MNNKNQEDDFYQDLDKKTAKKSFCSWPLMVAFFVFVLIIVIGLVFYLFREFKGRANNTNKNSSLEALYTLTLEKLKLNPETQPESQIELNSGEIESLLSEISVSGGKVKNIQVEIGDLGITISGALAESLKQSVKINVLPKVENGKIKMDVQKIIVGTVTIPTILYPLTERSLNSAIDKNFESFYQNYKIEKIELENDKIIIFGKLKNK